MNVVAVLLAAGTSCRFGPDDKLLAPWRSDTLVGCAAATLISAGCATTAAVVSAEEVAAALPAGVQRIRIPRGQPMSASFIAACAFAESAGSDALLIALGDMPEIRPKTLQRLLAQDQGGACVCGGIRMPPALLLRPHWQSVLASSGDHGARSAIAVMPSEWMIEIDLDEAVDVDTTRDLEGFCN